MAIKIEKGIMMARKIGPGWYGYLTRENIEEIALYLYDALKGRTYTWIAVQATNIPDYIGRVEVRPGERLLTRNCWTNGGLNGDSNHPLSLKMTEGDNYWSFHFATIYGSWGKMTKAADQYEARQMCDKLSRDVPYLTINYGNSSSSLVFNFEFRVPAGTLTQWIVSINPTPEELGEYE